MLEVKLPCEIHGKELADLIEKVMEKALVPKGYEIRTCPYHESYYSYTSRKLVKDEAERSIEAHKKMKGGTKERWGHVDIYASDSTFTPMINFGDEPKFDLKTKCNSFFLFVVEWHITPYTENAYVVEPNKPGYKKYENDVTSLIEELYSQLK